MFADIINKCSCLLVLWPGLAKPLLLNVLYHFVSLEACWELFVGGMRLDNQKPNILWYIFSLPFFCFQFRFSSFIQRVLYQKKVVKSFDARRREQSSSFFFSFIKIIRWKNENVQRSKFKNTANHTAQYKQMVLWNERKIFLGKGN